MHTTRYALTGGIGSGKSYVCHRLKAMGIDVYDCDAAAKRLMATDSRLQQQLSDLVGKDIFEGGTLDKAALTAFLLASAENNQKINSIVHPAVAQDFINSGLTWMESAILYEAHFEQYVDKVICVTAPLETRISRVMQRDGVTRQRATEWISRQMAQDEKARRADYVINNDGNESIDEQINSIIRSSQSE